MPFGFIKGALGVATGLKGLFGKKEKAPSVQDNLLAQAAGARAAADKYGFNPLTMLQYGNTAGTGLAPASGAPPLASLEVLLGGLDEFDPQVKADRERQRQADQLNFDLAKLKLEQARSGVVLGSQSVKETQSPLEIHEGVAALGFGRRPLSRPSYDDQATLPVFNVSGGQMQINGRLAQRIGLKPWDVFVAEDAEAVAGDIGQELFALPHVPGAVRSIGGIGDPFSPPPPPRAAGKGPSYSELTPQQQFELRRHGKVTIGGVVYHAGDIY